MKGVLGMSERRSRLNLLDATPANLDKQKLFHESKRSINKHSRSRLGSRKEESRSRGNLSNRDFM